VCTSFIAIDKKVVGVFVRFRARRHDADNEYPIRRYNYEIISEHKEDNYSNSLKSSSDYLDKYLNM
jgi:hypothetical protein